MRRIADLKSSLHPKESSGTTLVKTNGCITRLVHEGEMLAIMTTTDAAKLVLELLESAAVRDNVRRMLRESTDGRRKLFAEVLNPVLSVDFRRELV